jgi:hypothetical protein
LDSEPVTLTRRFNLTVDCPSLGIGARAVGSQDAVITDVNRNQLFGTARQVTGANRSPLRGDAGGRD